jgi:hypothetical protein
MKTVKVAKITALRFYRGEALATSCGDRLGH